MLVKIKAPLLRSIADVHVSDHSIAGAIAEMTTTLEIHVLNTVTVQANANAGTY